VEDHRELEQALLNGLPAAERQDFAVMMKRLAAAELAALRAKDTRPETGAHPTA
jgi:hypothetical protein